MRELEQTLLAQQEEGSFEPEGEGGEEEGCWTWVVLARDQKNGTGKKGDLCYEWREAPPPQGEFRWDKDEDRWTWYSHDGIPYDHDYGMWWNYRQDLWQTLCTAEKKIRYGKRVEELKFLVL